MTLEQHDFKPRGSIYKQIIFSPINTVLHYLRSSESTDLEPRYARPNMGCEHPRILVSLKVKVLVAQLYQTFCNLMDCSPPDSSDYGILQARILEWVAMPFSRRASQPRDRTPVSHIIGRFFTP